jgi:hypothetical protein
MPNRQGEHFKTGKAIQCDKSWFRNNKSINLHFDVSSQTLVSFSAHSCVGKITTIGEDLALFFADLLQIRFGALLTSPWES